MSKLNWIKCSDRLPWEDKKVLLKFRLSIPNRNGEAKKGYISGRRFGAFEVLKYYTPLKVLTREEVTHWAELDFPEE